MLLSRSSNGAAGKTDASVTPTYRVYLLRTRPNLRSRLSPLSLASSGIVPADNVINDKPGDEYRTQVQTQRAPAIGARPELDDVVAGPYELNEALDERQCACLSLTSSALSLTSDHLHAHAYATSGGAGVHTPARHTRLYLLIRATCVPDDVHKSALLQPSHVALNLLRFRPTSLSSERCVLVNNNLLLYIRKT